MIETEGLTLRIEERVILDGVSFRVEKGEAVALVGPNGSGKSSLLRCLLGLVPFEGRARIGGRDVIEDPVGAKALTAYLPQRPAFGGGTAEEVLAFFAKIRGVPRGRVSELLAEVGLLTHQKERARTFSGGMQQRLSLAIALLTDAPVLFLDEPTASLDRGGQSLFLDTVARFRKAGRTILFSSHRNDEIARLADRVIALDEGKIVKNTSASSEPQAPVIPLRARGVS